MPTKSLVAQTITCQTALRQQKITFSDMRNAIAGVVATIPNVISPRPLRASAAYFASLAYPNGRDASSVVGFNPHCESVDPASFAAADQVTVTLNFVSENDTHPNDQSLRVLVFYRKGVNKLTISVSAQTPVKDVSKAYVDAVYRGICLMLPDMNTIKREDFQVS